MQSLNTFCSKGASLGTTHHIGSDIGSCYTLKRRRKKRSDLGGSLVIYYSSHQKTLFSSSCSFFGIPNFNWRNGLLPNCLKFDVYEAKKSFSGRSFALALALDQEPVGSEHEKSVPNFDKSRSKVVGFDASNVVPNHKELDNSEDEVEEIVGSKESDPKSELAGKKRVDVRALARTMRDAKSADDVEELLKESVDLPLPVYSSMIKGFGMDKRLDAAFALVEWLKRRKKKDSNGRLSPNLFIYNSLLGAVKQAEQFDKVDEVMDDMKLQGIAPNIVTYNTLMSVYLEQGRPHEALDVLADIAHGGLSPSPVTYSTVLLAYKMMEDANGALSFFVNLREKFEKGEIKKDSDADWESEFAKLENFTIRICYLVMRQWLVKDANPTINVLRLLSDIDKARINPGRMEYERLVWACTCEGHYTVAKELYRRIREMDSGISLSICNHIIWLMGKAKKWWAALEIYEDLLDKGPKPNNLSHELIVSHFNILLTAARRRGIWRWGVRLLNKMQDKGLKPGTREWNAVLVACSKASETSAAVEIFRRMVDQGEKPTILSYGALLSALEKGKLYDEALKVWEHMCKVGVKPNLYAYTILASVYTGQGRFEMVDSVLREMVSSRIEPNVVTFNTIITGCARNRMSGVALDWFHRMSDRDIKPNEITYDMLIQALTQDSKPRLAYEMYLKACNDGLILSSGSYDSVIESCQAYNASIDVHALGPRPPEKKRSVKIRKNLTEFCDMADLPRRGTPFDKTEIYDSQIQERR